MADQKEVVITGIGLVSSHGEGAEHHWNLFGKDQSPEPVVNLDIVPPYGVHPMPEMDWANQIPRKDQRQMENWQRLGTYSAGLALDDAGIKENEDLLSSMDLVVAAGGGERDVETDENILKDAIASNDREQVLLDRLSTDLRPTLFLAQLSNLLAGNISIVHKVTGSSRTYMGEESAGVTVINNAMARIASGQSTHMLIGGSYNADRPDALLPHVLAHYLYDGGKDGVHARQKNGGGMRLGSVGAFLVLEEAGHAKARGVKPYAKLSGVAADLGTRDGDKGFARLDTMLEKLPVTPDAIVSGATGVSDATRFEMDYLKKKFGDDFPVRAMQTQIGQSLEANFPACVAFAALALHNNGFYAPFEPDEKPAPDSVSSVLVTSIGHVCSEGFAVLEKA
ncbi:MAG: beta-ketoacyl-ACP synthase [Rhizobiaceae bacterium]|jgi:3-oxoacyl-[acyl-carrier-protein] synthase II|nr:beta-ketoacyl-ACP synthase [Rhizobiaceae bacterium]